jgi:ABC-type nitrate/sulfonate/bicarbonate transport system permease component
MASSALADILQMAPGKGLRQPNRRARMATIQLVTLAAAVIVWQALGLAGRTVAELFPSVAAVLGALWQVLTDGELPPHLATSAYEVGAGLVFGVLPALAFGLLASLHAYTRRVFQPLMLYFSAVPYIIVFPVFILAFTIGPNSKVAMAAASAFFPMAINTIAASFAIRAVHVKVAQALRLSKWQLVRHIYIPSMAPGIVLGLRMAVAVAVVGALLAETKASRAGLGFLVFGAYRQLNIPRMYALLLLIFAFAAVVNWLMTLLAARTASARERSNVSGFFAA